MVLMCSIFFFKQKTAYEMRISDWSSDVCSSDLFDDDATPKAPARKPAAKSSAPEAAAAATATATVAAQSTTAMDTAQTPAPAARSEERRVGKACVRTCSSRWSPSH